MEIKVGDRIADVHLISKEGNQVTISIDDVLFELDIVTTVNGVFSIIHNGRSYNAEIVRSDNGYNYTVNTSFSSFPVEIINSQSKYMQSRKKENNFDNQDYIQSHMPGKVVRILVSEGDAVQTGQSLIIVEAMKMQNEYKVGKDCIVREICVNEGDNVTGGQILITLE